MKKSKMFYATGCENMKTLFEDYCKGNLTVQGATFETKEYIKYECNNERRHFVDCEQCKKKPVKYKVTIELKRIK